MFDGVSEKGLERQKNKKFVINFPVNLQLIELVVRNEKTFRDYLLKI
jgi:hypothetical protein